MQLKCRTTMGLDHLPDQLLGCLLNHLPTFPVEA
jgi:hypothetical protein